MSRTKVAQIISQRPNFKKEFIFEADPRQVRAIIKLLKDRNYDLVTIEEVK